MVVRATDGGEHPDGVTIAAKLFAIDRAVFMKALHAQPNRPLTGTAAENSERLRRAMLDLRQVVPEDYFSKWAHEHLPRIEESPLDILQGENGFKEFVELIEGIVHGDFA
jgi:hypothetical protein